MVATIYLGWHFFVDVLAGVGVGVAAVALAGRATGNPLRRRDEPWTFRMPLEAQERQVASASRSRSA